MQQWTLKEAFVKATGRGIAKAPGTRGFSVRASLPRTCYTCCCLARLHP